MANCNPCVFTYFGGGGPTHLDVCSGIVAKQRRCRTLAFFVYLVHICLSVRASTRRRRTFAFCVYQISRIYLSEPSPFAVALLWIEGNKGYGGRVDSGLQCARRLS